MGSILTFCLPIAERYEEDSEFRCFKMGLNQLYSKVTVVNIGLSLHLWLKPYQLVQNLYLRNVIFAADTKVSYMHKYSKYDIRCIIFL